MLKYYSYTLPFLVLILIFVGALVTSHDAGLSVPDWPTSYGHNMFLFPYSKWYGNIFYEHGHRLIASCIGFLTLILWVSTMLSSTSKKLKILSTIALLLVIIQGVLGGVTVLYGLPTWISSLHAIIAQTFFLLLILIAFNCSKFGSTKAIKNFSHKFFISLAVLVYIQLIVGAIMRHSAAGLAILDFPGIGGLFKLQDFNVWLQNLNSERALLQLKTVNYSQVFIHLLHRLLAIIIVLTFLSAIFFWSKLNTSAKKYFWYIAVILTSQVFLGAIIILAKKSPFLTSFHVATGALLLGTLFFASLTTRDFNSINNNQA